MKIFLILIFVVLAPAFAADSCLPSITRPELRSIIDEVISAHFPGLAAHSLPFVDCTSKSYFFQASIDKKALLSGKKKYYIEVNNKLLECPPTHEALRAIVTHELVHFSDYENLSVAGLIKLGVRYSVSKKIRRRYERQTDTRAIGLGEAPGLILYREWLYPQLSPKDLKVKQYYYLVPDEIRTLMDEYQM